MALTVSLDPLPTLIVSPMLFASDSERFGLLPRMIVVGVGVSVTSAILIIAPGGFIESAIGGIGLSYELEKYRFLHETGH
jgi:hypothetical protein